MPFQPDAKKMLDRFLTYVSIDTQSDPYSETQPSTVKQLTLQKILVNELKSLGIHDATLDEFGYVMATIPSNIASEVPVLGFLAHVDTSPDMPGVDVRPRIHHNYQGGEIVLNQEKQIVLSPAEFPGLLRYVGNTLITTDGTTLLGADDKAGVAAIMGMAEYLTRHPEVKHGTIRLGFTVDEEIGRGVDRFDVKRFGARYAYTIDGGSIGELEYENFNAAEARIEITGNNIHPGAAKNKMRNALLIAMELNDLLPATQRPDNTELYEGFFHLTMLRGEVEKAQMEYIIRDHNRERFEQKKALLLSKAEMLNRKYGKGSIVVKLKDEYANMREKIELHMHLIYTAQKAMALAGVEPVISPIRGGTDGARLSYMGLPCPNLFAGGENFHGKHEYLPLESLLKSTEVIVNLISLYAETPGGITKAP
ncbi:MAG: peptidase T [Bacteroidales bacterium]